jgi:hypothetical protein
MKTLPNTFSKRGYKEGSCGPATILVIDNNEMNRDLLSRRLA